MYLVKRLTQQDEFNTYEEHFMNSLGNEARLKTNALGEAYFKSSQVYALVDAQGEMVAGYILGMSKPYRLISFVPIEKITETLEKFELNNCCEIVCVWKKKTMSKADTAKYLWPNIFNNFLETKKQFLLGHNQNPKLDKRYGILAPRTLYYGLSTHQLPSRLILYSRFRIKLLYFIAKHIVANFLQLKAKI